MLSLDMLDVAIGIVFMFLLLSLICSAANEFIEGIMKKRAADLERGIRELLQDNDGTGLANSLYNHPLIFSLYKGGYDPSKNLKQVGKVSKDPMVPTEYRYSNKSNLPSYIPARNFALAFMDVVFPASAANIGGAAGAITTNQNQGQPTSPPGSMQQPEAVAKYQMQQLRQKVGSMKNDHVKELMLTLIDASGNDANKLREGVENWFNSSMDRVSGWYKRRAQRLAFYLGFVAAIALNADTFAVFSSLANDRPLRTTIVAAAQQANGIQNDTSKESIKRNINTLMELGLPIGWGWKNELNTNAKFSNLNAIPQSNEIGLWVLKVLGWLVTGIAVSLGAPFWFDVLNKIMVVRSTVKPAEKSPEEGSEDRQNKS